MPASQAQSVGEALVVYAEDNDNAMWVSPVSSLTQRMSGASFHSTTPYRGVGLAASIAGSAGIVKTPLLSDTVRFGIDDSNDSLFQFTAATANAATAASAAPSATPAVLLPRRRHTVADAAEAAPIVQDEEDEVDWVLGQAAEPADEDDTRGYGNGTPCRPRALTFCSSPSEPTVRRLWSPESGQAARMASVPFSFASSPTSAVKSTAERSHAARRLPLAQQRPLPPPVLPPPQPRRRSFKRPSPTSVAEVVSTAAPAPAAEVTGTPAGNRQAGTPKRRRLTKTPLGDATNASQLVPRPVDQQSQEQLAVAKKPMLQRCTSELSALTSKFSSTLDSVKVDKAIASIDAMNMIGNSEQQHSLPTVKELSYGIRYVTGATVSKLVRGQFLDRVSEYTIIDCRYPYEFEGGHIQGAVNIYKQEDLLARVMEPVVTRSSDPAASSQRTPVLIFHCEFSSERAPKLASYLRDNDRMRNAENYPNLYFPEVYVLQGGYKSFFESHKEDCQPLNYTRMADPGFKAELAACQRDRKTWERQNSRSKHSKLQRLASCQQFH